MIQKSKLGILSIVAVAMLLMVALVPVLANEDSNGDSAMETIYLRPGDTYIWTPTLSITDYDRIQLTVNASGTTTAGTFAATSSYGDVTATIDNRDVKIGVSSSATTASVTYVTVKATVIKGVSQTETAPITVKVIVPKISYDDTYNTYQGGTVAIDATITGASVDSKTVTYTISGQPDGLSINASTAKITGTVSSSAEAKTYTVTVRGTIQTTPSQTFSDTFDIIVAKAMTLTAPGNQYTAKGVSMDVALAGTNTTPATTWKITSDAVSGITMSTATGTSGKITVANTTAVGAYDVTYSATNPTSGQVVTKSVHIVVGNVAIGTITTTGGYVDTAADGKVTLYAKYGQIAQFDIGNTSNPTGENLALTLSKSGTNADKVTIDAQKISPSSTLEAGTYTFTLTETQASTGATASIDLTLVVDPVLKFENSVTSGSLSIKGAGN